MNLQKYWARRAMIHGDRRDGYLMDRAESHRRADKSKPAERAEMDLVDLAKFDRARERNQLTLATEDMQGRVWP